VVSALVHYGPARFFSVVRRSLAVAPLFIDPRPDGLFVANACVAPAYRSKGMFTGVLSHMFEMAKARKLARVELDVSFDNPRAQALYERLGFAITGERANTRGHGLPGFRRMEKAL
jgi:ribosomal protein S18 acetylase RimI-like enzyme